MTSRDDTFRAFTAMQATDYASNRGDAYPWPIYQAVLDFHRGDRALFLDVGTGPGKAAFDLLQHFDRGVGCDVSVQMVERAEREAADRGGEVARRFHCVVAGGEDCTDALSPEQTGQVDLITVAMSAHWLDLPVFYASAARALRSGGTLAMWTASSYYCHPSTPHAREVQAILSELEDGMLGPYTTPGNRLSRAAYEGITLPWDVKSGPAKDGFDSASFVRVDWDRDGVPSAPDEADGSPGPFLQSRIATADQLAAGFNSASMVVRWREANPEKVGGEGDPVRITTRRLKEVLGEGVAFSAAPSYSLLLMRKT